MITKADAEAIIHQILADAHQELTTKDTYRERLVKAVLSARSVTSQS